jgi:hypothetical protein
MFDKPPFLLPGVGLALRSTLRCQPVVIIPGHFCRQFFSQQIPRAPLGEQMDAVTDFREFGEHHRRTWQRIMQIGGEACRWIGGDAGEGVAAAALHADAQIRQGQRFPPPTDSAGPSFDRPL